MKTRIFSNEFGLAPKTSNVRSAIIFACMILGVGVFLSGCKSQIDDPTPTNYGSIRVMNFAPCVGAMDIYLQQKGQSPADTLPRIFGIKFGTSSVYSNNLPVAPGGTVYHLVASPVNQRGVELVSTDITLLPGSQFSWIVYHDAGNNTYPADVVRDADNAAGVGVTDYVNVRFVNSQSGMNGLRVRIGDNANGPFLGKSSVDFRGWSADDHSYTQIPFKPDTSYSFFIVNQDDTVLSRLAGVAFAPGSYHTLTFSGDPCKFAPNVKTGAALDSFRIRVLDDNGIGNDVTAPSIPQILRYNFVNGLIPVDFPGALTPPYAKELGIVINNDNLLNFQHMAPISVAPAPLASSSGNVNDVQFTSTLLTTAIDVKGFATDDLPDQARGRLLFDYRAGLRTSIVSDLPASLMIIDTPISTGRTADSTIVSEVMVPIPDQALHGAARLVLINGLAPARKPTVVPPLGNYVTINVNGTDDPFLQNKKPTSYDNTYILPGVPTGGSSPVTVTATCKASGTQPIETFTVTFDAKDGGIYEVVLLGQRGNSKYGPRFLVIRTNPIR
ncbi:MAG: hypothetical protein ABI444_10970 [Candidatus Kapaibacterium sp.]|jgi:hypothetical protein